MKIFLGNNPAAYVTCAETLRNGGIICYPTETFYALGTDPFNKSACDRLFQLKNRDPEKELPLIAASTKMVSQICDTFDPRFKILAAKYWPGPLTIVLPSLGHFRSYAIRVSSNSVARKISERFGKPIVSTSANISGMSPIQKPNDLSEELSNGIDFLLDDGPCAGGLPSTIISLMKPEVEILREGAISPKEILSML